MEDIEGFEFRFIVTGEYRSVHITGNRLVVNNDHYLNGSLFTVRRNSIIYSGQTLVMIDNTIGIDGAESPRVTLESYYITEARERAAHLLVFKCGDYYLDRSLQFQNSKDEALVVQAACVDPFDDYQPPENVPERADAGPLISADGVPLLTPNIQFCFNIVGETCSAVEDQNKLIFNDDNYTQGFNFNMVRENNQFYVKTSFNHKYLGILDNRVVYLDETPQHNIIITSVHYPSIFVLGNGHNYYKITFYKSNYGELIPVDDIAKATLLQFISI